MPDVRDNCRRVFDSIHNAAARSSRDPNGIRLIAVTKTVEVVRIRSAVEAGIREIGENRLQEALSKREGLGDLALSWHFIGHLQGNKAAKALEVFDGIQSVDRIGLAQKLNSYLTHRLSVLIEVNLGGEQSKSGVGEDGLSALIDGVKDLPNLELRGLMTVPPFAEDSEQSRQYFQRLRTLAERHHLTELSMGMSHDFEIAIEEGATMVRVGTALFGRRP